MLRKLTRLENRATNLIVELNDLKKGLEFTNEEVETVKDTVSNKAEKAHVAVLEKKLDDLENWSKRNNIVIWNIPEGTEKDSSCQEVVSNILSDHMQLEGDLEIMRAHRTNMQNASGNAATPLPRPVHVYPLRYTDKQYKKIKASKMGSHISCTVLRLDKAFTVRLVIAWPTS